MPLLIQQNKLSILSSLRHLYEGKTDNQKGKYFGLHNLWHDKKYKSAIILKWDLADNSTPFEPVRWTSCKKCLLYSHVKMLWTIIFKGIKWKMVYLVMYYCLKYKYEGTEL